MIDFGDFIQSQRGNVGFPRHKQKKRDSQSISIEEAKAKVEEIINSGTATRKRKSRIRNKKQSNDD